MLEKFQLSKDLVSKGMGRPFLGKKHGGVRVRHNMSDWEFLTLWKEVEMYSMLEESLSCSGMCEVSLFYFSRNITDGPPKSSCLMKFKRHMELLLEAYAATSILCGLNILVLFVLHFGLYCRPSAARQYEYQQAQNQGGGDRSRSGQYQAS